jgi:hypothetical protein
MSHARRFLVLATLTMAAAACGSDTPSSPSGGSDGTIGATLTITNAGITPKSVTVPLGSRVTIVNNASSSHDMNSDPHPEHTQCPALNGMFLTPGQSRTSQNLTTARTCGMHDHSDPDNAAWKTTIAVQ